MLRDGFVALHLVVRFDEEIQIFDINELYIGNLNGRERLQNGLSPLIVCIFSTPEGALVSVNRQGQINFWKVSNGHAKLVQTISAPSSYEYAVFRAPKSQDLLIGFLKHNAMTIFSVYSLRYGKQIAEIPLDSPFWTKAFASFGRGTVLIGQSLYQF